MPDEMAGQRHRPAISISRHVYAADFAIFREYFDASRYRRRVLGAQRQLTLARYSRSGADSPAAFSRHAQRYLHYYAYGRYRRAIRRIPATDYGEISSVPLPHDMPIFDGPTRCRHAALRLLTTAGFTGRLARRNSRHAAQAPCFYW